MQMTYIKMNIHWYDHTYILTFYNVPQMNVKYYNCSYLKPVATPARQFGHAMQI